MRIALDLGPNHGLHVKVTLFQRLPVRRPRRNVLEVPQQVGVGAQVQLGVEAAHGGQAKDAHNVRQAELLACQVLVALEPVVQVLQGGLRARREGGYDGAVVGQPRQEEHHVARHGRLQRAVGKVQPLQVLAVLGVLGRAHEAQARGGLGPVDVGNVLHDGARLGQTDGWADVGVAEVGRSAKAAELLQFLGRERRLGVALVDVQVIGNVELLLEVRLANNGLTRGTEGNMTMVR